MQFVSDAAFARLGVGPAAGRLLTTQDDQRPGAHPVAILSHAFWMQRFGGDPGLGRWFVIHRRKTIVIRDHRRRPDRVPRLRARLFDRRLHP